jgi:F0F1-type ATP synthase epsilon subunit
MAETSSSTNSGLLSVRLVTPDRLLLDATAEAVELPSMSGYLEALYGAGRRAIRSFLSPGVLSRCCRSE